MAGQLDGAQCFPAFGLVLAVEGFSLGAGVVRLVVIGITSPVLEAIRRQGGLGAVATQLPALGVGWYGWHCLIANVLGGSRYG